MSAETTVRDETVTLDGLRFHYRDWGPPDARPLVLPAGAHGYRSPGGPLGAPGQPPWLCRGSTGDPRRGDVIGDEL
jgi:hypothetical protein